MVEKAQKTKKRESLGIPFAFLMIFYCCYSLRLVYFSDLLYNQWHETWPSAFSPLHEKIDFLNSSKNDQVHTLFSTDMS